MKKYHGVQVRKDKNGEDKKYPIFMGETATSLVVYTTFESLLPFKWDDISVKEDSNSVSVVLSNEALPCIEMTSMLKFRLCQDENKASCFMEGSNRNISHGTSFALSTEFHQLPSCTPYLVSKQHGLVASYMIRFISTHNIINNHRPNYIYTNPKTM